MSLLKRILLAIVSGVLVWPLSHLLDGAGKWGSYIAAGVPFGALVLVPLVSRERHRAAAIIALVLGSILIYALAVELAVEGYGPLQLGKASRVSLNVSGLLGALLVCALTVVAAPLKSSSQLWMAVSGAGLVGGFLFGLTIAADGAMAVAGYVAWQVLVCHALSFGARARPDA